MVDKLNINYGLHLLYIVKIFNSTVFKKNTNSRRNKMEKTKKRIELNIAGNTLFLMTDEDEEYVKKLGAKISQRINTLALSGGGISKTDAAIVCALDLLDENYKLKMALEDAKK